MKAGEILPGDRVVSPATGLWYEVADINLEDSRIYLRFVKGDGSFGMWLPIDREMMVRRGPRKGRK